MNEINTYDKIKKGSEKSFGYFFSIVLIITPIFIYGLLETISLIFYIIGIALIIITKFIPNILIPLNNLWITFSIFLSKLFTPMIMLLIYISLFLPIGPVYKILGKDPMLRQMNTSTNTYWKKRSHKIEDMRKQY